MARRVVCRLKAGDRVAAATRIGLMKFGSRMDVFVPITATLLVGAGDAVRGGETVIARLAGSGHDRSVGRSARRAATPRKFRRGMFLLPSIFTVGNMFCGYACVVYAMRGDLGTRPRRSSASPSCSTCSTAASRA